MTNLCKPELILYHAKATLHPDFCPPVLTCFFSKDQQVLGDASSAIGWIDSLDLASHKIKFHQNATTGFASFNIGESISIGPATATIVNIKTSE